ncbi:MAG: hypothetical protein AAF555_10440 [Verrucomicrobiota bacterium]
MSTRPSFLRRLSEVFSFPGLFFYIACLNAVTFALELANPLLVEWIRLDWNAVFRGELWRLVSFLFVPWEDPRNPWAWIFIFFVLLLARLFTQVIEATWGVAKASGYVYLGILGNILGSLYLHLITGGSGPFLGGAALLSLSMFLAFATLQPNVPLMLFFVLPVKVKYLGWVAAAFVVLAMLGSPILFPFFALSLGNYLLIFGPGTLRSWKQNSQTTKRRADFKGKNLPETESFHLCVECGATELSHPELEFRIGEDGEEYCGACLAKRKSL